MSTVRDRVEKLAVSKGLSEGYRLYLFGSTEQESASPNDVDLLLIYPDGLLGEAHALAASIRSMMVVPMYDVMVASETEEAELGLVAKQRAVLVWPKG